MNKYLQISLQSCDIHKENKKTFTLTTIIKYTCTFVFLLFCWISM